MVRKSLTSSTVLYSWMINPGTEAPIVIESNVHNIPEKVTIFAFYLLNQFKAILLGVLRMKILPIAAESDPRRQNSDFPTSKSNLNHTPVITKAAPIIKEIRIPCLFSSQLQGTENRG